MGQVGLVAHIGEEIGRPVPAMGGLEDDVAADRSGADFLGEMVGFVIDPDRVDLLAGPVRPVNDGPSGV
jgi:hypothetical protein